MGVGGFCDGNLEGRKSGGKGASPAPPGTFRVEGFAAGLVLVVGKGSGGSDAASGTAGRSPGDSGKAVSRTSGAGGLLVKSGGRGASSTTLGGVLETVNGENADPAEDEDESPSG